MIVLELTASQAKYLRDCIHARASLIAEVAADSTDVSERMELAAQHELGETLAVQMTFAILNEEKATP